MYALTKRYKTITVFSAFFYAVAIILMILGTVFDLQIDKAVFDPQSSFALGFESFGLFVYWGMWGPIFAVLFLTSHNLNECLEIIGKVFPFIRPVKNTQTNTYKFFNTAVTVFFKVLFFVLGVIGWKKLVENVLKHIFDLPQVFYFAVCTVITALAIFAFSRIKKETLYKLEALALAGVLFGIFLKFIEYSKQITGRIRFREMVAASNGFFDDEGLSFGKTKNLATRLDKSMVNGTDFSAFAPWYKICKDSGIYSHADSFPSGHTSCSCALFLSILFCNAFERLKKFVPLAAIFSAVYVLVMGFSRLVAGAHYLTDVAGAVIIAYTLFLVVYAVFDKFISKEIFPTVKTDK